MFLIIVHPCRVSIESLACSLGIISPRDIGFKQSSDTNFFSQEVKRRYMISFLILLVSYTFAFINPDLERGLAFVGATGGVTMCFILPTIFHVILADFETEKRSIAIALWISIFGAACGIAEVIVLFIVSPS